MDAYRIGSEMVEKYGTDTNEQEMADFKKTYEETPGYSGLNMARQRPFLLRQLFVFNSPPPVRMKKRRSYYDKDKNISIKGAWLQ